MFQLFRGSRRIATQFGFCRINQSTMNTGGDELKTDDSESIHSKGLQEVTDVPIDVIIRPFPPVLDEEKVHSLVNTIKDGADISVVPPIDVLWIKGREGGKFYTTYVQWFAKMDVGLRGCEGSPKAHQQKDGGVTIFRH
ncbi:uncharacterized protein srxn1 isoform X2 [Corythoichthys intestinalis]|uniref:uncharacterized protein srxn1 isoform X2 n=1 Tax=Corythoichthys intestinalis TaxID=161448 RepID=UPI0025A5C872|nr:uncharacterized protein srxn1 isoform X2 [Corythoichthys intestinalis]